MLNSNNERALSRSGTLIFAVLFSVAGLGQPVAQTQSPWSHGFDERFTGERQVVPLFTRPEVISSLPSLPQTSLDESAPEPGRGAPTFTRPEVTSGQPSLPLISPHEGAPEPATTASTKPREAPEREGQPDRTEKKGVASALKELVISPAEAETSPTPPPSDAPQPSEPHEIAATAPPSQPTIKWRLPVARLITSSYLNHPAVQLRAIGSTRLSRAGQAEPGEALPQAARPRGFSRLAQLGSGRATWYQHPGQTASGEKFNPNAPTAAHKTLPLGTQVRVVNKKNNRSMTVRINDRMPAEAKAVIDLSRGSARALGIKGDGSVALQKAE